jgi:hypothetical protein
MVEARRQFPMTGHRITLYPTRARWSFSERLEIVLQSPADLCNSVSPRSFSSSTGILLAFRPPSLTPSPYSADQRDSLIFVLDLWKILLPMAFDELFDCFLPTPVLAAKLNPPACRHWLCAVSSAGWSNVSSHRSHRYWMICDGDIFGGLCRWLICDALDHIMARTWSIGFSTMDRRCSHGWVP